MINCWNSSSLGVLRNGTILSNNNLPVNSVTAIEVFHSRQRGHVSPAACAAGDKAAHGSSGYTLGQHPLLDILHFVARRRLPVVKRTATMPGAYRSQGQDRATYCIAHPFGG